MVTFQIEFHEGLGLHGTLRLKARGDRNGRPKITHEASVGPSLTRTTGRWAERRMTLDHDSDIYEELVTDKETDEVLHYVREPLSEHRGHGSATQSKQDG